MARNSHEDELTEDQVARHDAIEAKMDAIQAQEDQYDDTTKAAATVFVYLDYHGSRTYFGVRPDFDNGDYMRDGDDVIAGDDDNEEDGNEEGEESEHRPNPAADDKLSLSGALTAVSVQPKRQSCVTAAPRLIREVLQRLDFVRWRK